MQQMKLPVRVSDIPVSIQTDPTATDSANVMASSKEDHRLWAIEAMEQERNNEIKELKGTHAKQIRALQQVHEQTTAYGDQRCGESRA
ncbi:hypothetical protein GP486_005742, partial [Trichoglossum hirsutum]